LNLTEDTNPLAQTREYRS